MSTSGTVGLTSRASIRARRDGSDRRADRSAASVIHERAGERGAQRLACRPRRVRSDPALAFARGPRALSREASSVVGVEALG